MQSMKRKREEDNSILLYQLAVQDDIPVEDSSFPSLVIPPIVIRGGDETVVTIGKDFNPLISLVGGRELGDGGVKITQAGCDAAPQESPEEILHCPHCTYSCIGRGRMEVHIISHSQPKKHTCDFEGCNYSCRAESTMRRHKVIHAEVKPFACTYEGCTYRAGREEELKTHQRTHTKEKPFACTHEGCSYTCAQKSTLRVHQRSHTGSRPYKCPGHNCFYSSVDKSTLNRHYKRKHYDEMTGQKEV